MRPYKLGKRCIYNISYHIVFCPKRRKQILTGDLKNDLIEIFNSVCSEMGITIEFFEIMPDHVHLFVSSKPHISPHIIVKRLKGRASRLLRAKYAEVLNKLPAMWSSSYFIGTVGFVSETVVKNYIASQRGI
jgi:putative transposase